MITHAIIITMFLIVPTMISAFATINTFLPHATGWRRMGVIGSLSSSFFFVTDPSPKSTSASESDAESESATKATAKMTRSRQLVPSPPSNPPPLKMFPTSSSSSSTTKTATVTPFDPLDVGGLVMLTRSFIELTDMLGRTDSSSFSSSSFTIAAPLPPPPRLSSSFVWISINNLDSPYGLGIGPLTKGEYLATFRKYDVRGMFPDLNYNAYDYRVTYECDDQREGMGGTGGDIDEVGGEEEKVDEVLSEGVTPIERLLRKDSNNDDIDGVLTTTAPTIKEVTVRFTTRVTGTFGGDVAFPFNSRDGMGRTMILPDGTGRRKKRMVCPPTCVSVTYSARLSDSDYGTVTRLVTDVVLDRLVGNTGGLSGIPGMAIACGAELDELLDVGVPPLTLLDRYLSRPTINIKKKDKTTEKRERVMRERIERAERRKMMGLRYAGVDSGGESVDQDDLTIIQRTPSPFPEEIMVKLAMGVIASDLGRGNPDLLSENFVYVEPLIGPLDKESYLKLFANELYAGEGVPDFDYGSQNFRVDPYDPYRVWVDIRATGTRIGNIGKQALPPNVDSISYKASPEGFSFTFDDDGYCIRLTAAAVLDPFFPDSNTGGLGGVYGLLYATGTPKSMLRTRSINGIFNRAIKGMLSGIIGVKPDEWRLSDGRTLGSRGPSLPSVASRRATSESALPSTTVSMLTLASSSLASSLSSPALVKEKPEVDVPSVRLFSPKRPTIPIDTASLLPIDDTPTDLVTEALNKAFGIASTNKSIPNEVVNPASVTAPLSSSIGARVQQLDSTRAARAEDVKVRVKFAALKARDASERNAAMAAMLDKQTQKGLNRKQLLETAGEKDISKGTVTQQSLLTDLPSVNKANPNKADTMGGVISSLKSGGPLSKFSQTTAAKISTSDRSPSSKAQPAPAAVPSPTLSLFDSFKLSTPLLLKPPAVERQSKTLMMTKGSTVRRLSPSRFEPSSATTKSSPLKASAIPKAKGSSANNTRLNEKAPTVKIVGVGGASQLLGGIKKSSTKSTASPVIKEKRSPFSTSKTPEVKKVIATTRSPTVNIVQQTTTANSKTTPVYQSKAVMTKSPTFSLFGGVRVGDGFIGKAQPSVTPAKTIDKTPFVAKKSSARKVPQMSPTFSLFGGVRVGDGSIEKALLMTKSPTFSLFGGGRAGDVSVEKAEPSVTLAKTIEKTPLVARKSSARKVPLLKQWKINKDNTVEGFIYGSKSFKDGMFVTTSPVLKRKFGNGNLVRTSSGSEYLLE